MHALSRPDLQPMDTDSLTPQLSTAQKEEGIKSYYLTKIEELQLVVADRMQNLRRLEAQRNELNAKGIHCVHCFFRNCVV